MATSSPIDLLRKACTGNLSTNTSLSEDGKNLIILGSAPYDATTPHTLTLSDGKGGTKEVSYTLASIYLQLLNPSVLQYRKACESANVEDTVKILDKTHISEYFFDSGAEGEDDAAAAATEGDDDNKADDAMDMSDDEAAAGSEDGAKEAVQFSHTSDEKRSSRSGSRGDKEHRRRSESRGRDKDRSSSKHGRRSHSKSSRKEEESHDDRKKSSSSKGSKTPMVPITNEQLVANLSTIVDKRDTAANTGTPLKEGANEDDGAATDDTPGEDSTQITPAITPVPTDDEGMLNEEAEKKEKEDRELLLSWLSPVGFQVNSPTVASAIEADRDAVQRITALEIPVGDSASILRAGAGGEIVDKSNEATSASSAGGNVKKRDFARVLEIYQEVVVAEEKAKRSSSSSSGKKRPPPPPSSNRGKSPRTSSGASSASGKSTKSIEGNPIIVVPNAMTSCITMINAGFFLGKDAVFIPRQQAMSNPDAGKRGGTITITRKLNARLGGSEITYDIIDNPMIRLKKEEWNRVVAVVCQGAAWQFKGWRYSEPVDLFSRTFGFYVGLEGAPVPNELKGWNVKTGMVSRDRRGSDNVCLASFWNGLEEFMAVHKRDLIN
mmetsp:Transcript_16641/g.35964  ORF Transcript_16641/g.35964 Transcript_16641/m.35964 type:complete len:608 (+) Transcript_16641:30-1853(+)